MIAQTSEAFVPAARLSRIQPSPSTAAAARVRELKDAGRRVLDLTVGEPDADTPEHIKRAAIAAIEAGETKYTPVNGTPRLRAAIRASLVRTHGVEYSDAEITVGGGGKQVLFLALMASLDPGDEVIVPAPYWVSYPDMVRANEGTPVFAATTSATGYRLTAEALEDLLTERTRWLILNSPGNPTGAIYTEPELGAIAEVLRRHPRVLVLSDEIYSEISFTGSPAPSLVAVAPDLRDRVLVVSGVSKSYAMTGWRLGYAAGHPRLIRAINTLQSQTSSCPSSISQAAAAAALEGPQEVITEAVERYRERRDAALVGLRRIPGLVPLAPDGAFYLFVDCAGLIGRTTPDGRVLADDQDVTLYLLDHAGVAVIQGSAYGRSPFFRISFATDVDTITASVAAIGAAVEALA
ncbi:aspartate transaminase [Microbacterium sp. ZXX196]|uniref:aspartate transaminase n=1 Tax=Microbacterium sp. ZXX196 TaxID=2609291 RepID=UPI0012B7020F|nr:aspartate transaminase [Microbacterium sp. ZXX196]MTE23338.1 aspartate transaminase [Microbacterium sp. ZXX196]